MRVPIEHQWVEPYHLERALHTLPHLGFEERGVEVKLHGFLDLVADSIDGVPGVHRALKDHRDVVPAMLTHLGLGEFQEVFAI